MEELSLSQLIHMLPEYFQPDRAAGVEVIVQVNLEGDKGGAWYVTIQNQTCMVTDGTCDNAQVTIEVPAQDVLEMIDGTLDPMSAFMMGRLQVKGDRGKAMRLISLFKVTKLPF